MKIPRNLPRIANPRAPMDSVYTHPPEPSGGAMEYAPAQTRIFPPTPYYGNGFPVSDPPRIDTGPMLRSEPVRLAVPLSGSGITAQYVPTDNPLTTSQYDELQNEAEYE